jgi:hypothetical protein
MHALQGACALHSIHRAKDFAGSLAIHKLLLVFERTVTLCSQRTVRLVDPSRGLQCKPALGFGGGGVAVRVNFALQLSVRGVELPGVQTITRR